MMSSPLSMIDDDLIFRYLYLWYEYTEIPPTSYTRCYSLLLYRSVSFSKRDQRNQEKPEGLRPTAVPPHTPASSTIIVESSYSSTNVLRNVAHPADDIVLFTIHCCPWLFD